MKKIIFLISTIITFFLISLNVSAKDIEELNYFVITKDGEIEQLEDSFEKAHIDFSTINEISVLSVQINEEEINQFNSIIEENKEIVVDYGEDITVNKPQTIPFSTSSVLENDNIDNMDEVNWDWGIDEVTSNGHSYLKQIGTHETTIGIIDSGIDYNHPSLKENIVSRGKSFVPGVNSTEDIMGHGTMVAGIIASNKDFKGVAPGIGIIPYKVFHDGNGQSSWVIEAIVAAVNDGVDVINLSLGSYVVLDDPDSQATLKAYEAAIDYATKEGVPVVAASGTSEVGLDISNPSTLGKEMDSKSEVVLVPGMLENVITVSGTNKDKQISYFSNYGKGVDISAPSGDYGPYYEEEGFIDLSYMCRTTYPTSMEQSYISQLVGFDKGYDLSAGTSLATPHVSATIALMLDQAKLNNQSLNRDQLIEIIKKSSTKYGLGGDITKESHGILNTNNALQVLNHELGKN